MMIIRHTETLFNIQNRLQGHVDTELTKNGLMQAYDSRELLLKNNKIDLIVCSPLKRTKRLAQIINEKISVPLEYDYRLIERGYGKLEGLKGEQIDIQKLWDLDINYSKDNVEPVLSFLNRMNEFLDEYKQRCTNKRVLFVTHSGNSIAANCYFNGIPKDKNLLKLGLMNGEFIRYKVNN